MRPTLKSLNFNLLLIICILSAVEIYYITFCYKDFGLYYYPKED